MVSDRPPFAEARAAAAAELARDPANRSACAVLGRCAVLLRRGQEFVQVMDHWATVSGDRGRLCNSVLAGVLNEGGWCDLLVLIEMVPRESPWHILCLYYAGCAAMMLDQRPSALEFFRRFRTTVRYYAEHIAFFEDASLNVALRQGRLVADADEVRRRLAEPVPAPAITWLHDLPAPSDAVVFVACNGLYANLVAEDFVREVDGVRGRYGLHLHVIDPDDQSLAVIDRILTASRNVAITTETQPFARTKTYFSCSRLFVMEQILRHHDRPIVALDIDIALELPIESLLQASDGADFACFTTGRNEPASTYQASIMVWRNSDAALGFANALGRFCWPEIANPSVVTWMLDQAALFSLLSLPEDEALVRYRDLRTALGIDIYTALRVIMSDENKFACQVALAPFEPAAATY